jgi:predicted cation transporter
MKEREEYYDSSILIMYWCIHPYHIYKVEDIELRVMQVVLIRGYKYNWKK